MENETVVQMYLVRTSAQFEKTDRLLSREEQEKLNGRICSFCKTPLPPKTARGQTYCKHCPPAGAHRIRMDFRFLQRRWHCGFRDVDAGEMLPAQLCFEHAESLYALARRGRGFVGGGRMTKSAFFNSIGNGCGVISLTLDDSQYQALRTASQRKTARTCALPGGK